MFARVFLVLSAILWLPYGLYCLLDPGSLAQTAGVAAHTPTGTTELRAMYGGLQSAIGTLALVGALRGSVTRTALVAVGTLTLGLGSARLLGLLIDHSFTFYTGMGLGFEWTSALVSRWLLSRGQ
jgi:uncharacterized protein DUF4345